MPSVSGLLLESQAEREVSAIGLSEIISALSHALDLTGGQDMGHAVRTCVVGMRIAEELGLPIDLRSDLYYSLLMKDAGCSSNASRMFQLLGTDDIKAKFDVKTTDWTRTGWETLQYAISHVRTKAPFIERVRALATAAMNQKRDAKEVVQIRCERGADIARRIGLSEAASSAIYSLDELWNGRGQPEGLREREIPLLSRIMNLAQTVDVFYSQRGASAALEVTQKRSGVWFDPEVVRAFQSIGRKKSLWSDVDNAAKRVVDLEPEAHRLVADDATIDKICLAFADVIDAKSPFTYRHSLGVATAAVGMGRTLGLSEADLKLVRRAGLLHDLGKLGVSNEILEKPARLEESEWEAVRRHPYFTFVILKRIPGFWALSETAASHHERLDGTGYYRRLSGDQLSLPSRILAVAEIYDSLATRHPYRDALALDRVFSVLEGDIPHKLDANCVEALKTIRPPVRPDGNQALSQVTMPA